MTFSNDKAIYLQMADRLCDEILAGTYGADVRIPSVREYAVMLEVNTNTAVKAYDALARDGIIYNRRGLGYFVSPTARDTIMQSRRREFIDRTLPGMFRNMRLLDIGMDEVVERWNEENGDKGR
ncbi:MAG: GntR family transcriptional regulator [Prevotella sp.]|nr:GntR family transcriptional regulator [Prevotella sp.]